MNGILKYPVTVTGAVRVSGLPVLIGKVLYVLILEEFYIALPEHLAWRGVYLMAM